MVRVLKKIAATLLVITTSLSFASESHVELGGMLKSDQSSAKVYHHGWLGLLAVASFYNGYKVTDSSEGYAYREAYALVGIRSVLGILKFFFDPARTLYAYGQYQMILGNSELSEEEKNQQIKELSFQVYKDYQKKRSITRYFVNAGINTLIAGRIWQKTEDRGLAAATFISGLLLQAMIYWTFPARTGKWLESNKEQWAFSLEAGSGNRDYALGLTYHFN